MLAGIHLDSTPVSCTLDQLAGDVAAVSCLRTSSPRAEDLAGDVVSELDSSSELYTILWRRAPPERTILQKLNHEEYATMNTIRTLIAYALFAFAAIAMISSCKSNNSDKIITSIVAAIMAFGIMPNKPTTETASGESAVGQELPGAAHVEHQPLIQKTEVSWDKEPCGSCGQMTVHKWWKYPDGAATVQCKGCGVSRDLNPR